MLLDIENWLMTLFAELFNSKWKPKIKKTRTYFWQKIYAQLTYALVTSPLRSH